MDGIEKQYKGQEVKFIRVDVATQEGKDLAGQYCVFGTPVLVLHNQGKEVNRLMGYQSAENLTKVLNELL